MTDLVALMEAAVSPRVAAEATSNWLDALLPWVTFISGILLGTVSGFWYAVHARRPKLRIVGNSGIGGPGAQWTQEIQIGLAPAKLGGYVGETVIFGRMLIPSFTWGLSTAREPARGCQPWLKDAERRHQISPLRWTTGVNSEALDITPTIGPEDWFRLPLFGGDGGPSDPFYVLSGSAPTPGVPGKSTITRGSRPFTHDHRFLVFINHQHGRALRQYVWVKQSLDGSWSMRLGRRKG